MAEKKVVKLSNGQRKAIAKAKDAEMEELINVAKKELEARRQELLQQVMEEHGIDLCYGMIEEYDGYVTKNREKLRKKGMSVHRPGVVAHGGVVYLRLNELTGEYIQRVKDLHLKRTTIAQKVWQAETVDDLPDLPE